MRQYIKKPIPITATQWDGETDSLFAISNMMGFKVGLDLVRNQPYIETLEGKMIVSPGDYIIKGIKGECYPCKADIFEESYTCVELESEVNSIPITNPSEEPDFLFGEKLIGLSFNPSQDPNVYKAKQLCAQLADLLNQVYNNPMPPNENHRPLYEMLFQKALGDIIDAQMNVVKVLTFKY